MGLFKPKEDHIDQVCEVSTKEAMKAAIKNKYGRIKLTGYLVEEMEKEVLGAHFTSVISLPIAIAMLAIPVADVLLLPVAIGELFLSSKMFKSIKFVDYEIRSIDDELILYYSKYVNRIKDKHYKGQHRLKANNLYELNDMIDAKVDEITIDFSYVEDLIKKINESNILKKDLNMNTFDKYKGYRRCVDDSHNIVFVRIR